MTQPEQLDETDSRLLHALQIEPRATWQDLAPVVGVDPGTLARRWHRLRSDGIAWSTGYRPAGQMAMLELECEHGQLQAVAEGLRKDREALVVDYSSGSRDLLVLAEADDLQAMSHYSVDRLGQVAGIRSVRTHLINELLMEAVSWRLRSLSPAEVHRIPPPRPPRPALLRGAVQPARLPGDLGPRRAPGRAPGGPAAARTAGHGAPPTADRGGDRGRSRPAPAAHLNTGPDAVDSVSKTGYKDRMRLLILTDD
ncbi:MAG: Lrp/AsnC family transcriptional regulator, partial [Actinobacteria bacterium]|nr:Lrp/AsnC family transcriptional regulator [Actinomycetota bacterium]